MRPECLIEPLVRDVSAHDAPFDHDLCRGGDYLQGTLALKGDEANLPRLKGQLLKWIGNKQKFAREICGYLPLDYGTYIEPFLGSGAVLAHLAPPKAIASDVFGPLMEIWQMLQRDTPAVIGWYAERHALVERLGKVEAYEKVKASYNGAPNGADLLFLSRVCYGGVVRFRKADGYMSTPCGPHRPMPPANFAERAWIWAARTKSVDFVHCDFVESLRRAKAGDVCYLDPPYADSQTIIYGAQTFSLDRLFEAVEDCKRRGVRVALSLDGTKKSGTKQIEFSLPPGLFEQEVIVHLGRSMLRRFQMDGQTLESEHVTDRLLLTY